MPNRPGESGDEENPEFEELRRRDYRRYVWLKEFGVRLPAWVDESQAPPVDEGQIRSLLEGGLDKQTDVQLTRLIGRFRSWARAYCRLGLEQDRRDKGEGENR
jgi:hypothetical protein